MYTAPPSGDGENRTRPEFEDADEANEDAAVESDATAVEAESETSAEGERGSPTLEPTTGTTDANWTGTVPADD